MKHLHRNQEVAFKIYACRLHV